MGRRPISTWDTTSALPTPNFLATTIGLPGAFTNRSSPRSGAAIISGKTVQVIPHVTNEIKAAMKKVAQDVDVAIIEIGGTVGDIESLPFIEAIRQMRQELGRENTLFMHVTLVPFIAAAQELKTKPTQHSVKELLSMGIQPDILLCRTDRFLSKEIKSKIALFCNVEEEAVITAKDVASIYEVPLVFAHEGVDTLVLRYLHLEAKDRDLTQWEDLCTGSTTRRLRSRSASSASTSSTKIPTSH